MSLPASSAIPGALVNFIALAQSALGQSATVWWGKELETYSAPVTLQITEITGTQDPAEIGQSYRREETFQLICTLSVYQGGPQGTANIACLQEVMAQFALVSAAIGNNPTLSGAVRFAEVKNFLLTPDTDGNGTTAVTLDFQVACSQRVRSLQSS